MPPPPLNDLDVDQLVQRYRNGETLRELAADVGCSQKAISWRLRARGEVLRPAHSKPLDIPDVEDLIQAYIDGQPMSKVTARAGISDKTLKRRLEQRGIPIRIRSSYPAVTGPAHAAARGRKVPMESLVAMAAGRHGSTTGASAYELELACWLAARGLVTVPQYAVGKYNVDLAVEVPRVAVEVRAGGYGPRSLARWPQRVVDLLDAGWDLVEVRVRYFPLTPDLADKLVAYVECRRGQPAAAREHRVVRGNGQPMTPRRRQGKDRTVELRAIPGLD